MPWVKLDDQFPDHPKVVRAGPAAAWLYVCGLAYCARHLTNGELPAAQLPKLVAGRVMKLAARLVEVELWEPMAGGFKVHDYLQYNPTREQVLALRKQKADAGRRGGYQKAGTVPGGRQPFASATSAAPVPQPVPIPQPVDLPSSEHQPKETDSNPNTHIGRVRILAVPKPGLPVGSPHLALFQAFARALHCAEPTTTSERKKWSAPISELVRAGVDADEILPLVKAFDESTSPDVPCTPQGIANRLSSLRTPRVKTKAARQDEPRGYEGMREAFADLDHRTALGAAQ